MPTGLDPLFIILFEFLLTTGLVSGLYLTDGGLAYELI
jgi:hypothetical protein